MSERRTPHLRVVGTDTPAGIHAASGRPEPERRGIMWSSVAFRLMVIAWAGGIIGVLVQSFSSLPLLSFWSAIGMSGLLVATVLVVTHSGMPDWRGDVVVPRRDESEDATNDLLTNLPTLNHFQRRLGDEFQRTRRMGKTVSVVLVDVNNLTAVNKEYGVRAGDEVLRHVARCADETKRYNDVVSRLGDDEFGVLLMDCAEEGVRAFIDRLEERLARESASAEVDGRQISLWAGVCSGAATSTPEMVASDDVLSAAMANLNQAKQDRERRRRMWLSA